MNSTDLTNALLLLQSGELPEAERIRLQQRLEEDPELAAQAQELEILQEAGRYASQQITPGLTELQRERILQQSRSDTSRWMPTFLAAAAAVAILLLGLPFLFPSMTDSSDIHVVQLDSQPPLETASSEQESLPEPGELWDEVTELEAELADWQSLSLSDAWLVGDEAAWAAALLTPGDSI